MKKLITLVVFLILLCSVPVLALDAPTLTVTTSGVNVTLSWTPVPSATGYTLFYAPYPDASYIGQIDMGTQTSFVFDASGLAFYVAIQSYNSSGSSGYSNIEYFDLSSSNSTCGAYVAPGVWKEFDCYNLAAIGKTTNDDPFTPSWRLIGGHWQWGRKGPDSKGYDTNTENFAHGPTGPDSGATNEEFISNWDKNEAPDGSWSDATKTADDPCPAGYRVPSKSVWDGVIDNLTAVSVVGTWENVAATNYGSALLFGTDLLLPAAGLRAYGTGALYLVGDMGHYWSSTDAPSSPGNVITGNYAYYLEMQPYISLDVKYRRHGMSVRCVAE